MRERLLLGTCTLWVLFFLVLKTSPLLTKPADDEYIVVYDAQRLQMGEVPYRDFFNLIPPGTFWVLAGWSKLIPVHAPLTLGRYLSLLAVLAGWGLIIRQLRRASLPTGSAIALATLYPLALYPFWGIPSHHWFAPPFFFMALDAYDFQRGRVREPYGWFWCGVTTALASLFLQTIMLDMMAFWAVVWLLTSSRRLRDALGAVGGFFVVLLPAVGWLASQGALKACIRDTITWNWKNYARPGGFNAVPVLGDLPGRLKSLWHWEPWHVAVPGTMVFGGILLLWACILILAFVVFVLALKRRTFASPLQTAAILITVLDMGLFLKGRPDWSHLLSAMATWPVVWPLALAGARERLQGGWAKMRPALWVLLACATYCHLAPLQLSSSHGPGFLDADSAGMNAPIIRWLNSRPWLKPGDTLAAFPVGGQIYLYSRPAAVGYTRFTPLNERLNDLEDHEVVARQLSARKPRCVLIRADQEEAFLDPASPVGLALRRDYARYGRVDQYVIYPRRP